MGWTMIRTISMLTAVMMVSCSGSSVDDTSNTVREPTDAPEPSRAAAESVSLVPEIESLERDSLAIEFATVDYPNLDVAETAYEEYHQILEIVRHGYSRTTDGMIRDATYTVYAAKQYWSGITLHYCLQLLVDNIPPEASIDTVTVGSVRSSAGWADTAAASRTSISVDAPSIRQVSTEIYAQLEYEYHRPSIERQQQVQQRIQQNLDAARQRGQGANQARQQAMERALTPDPAQSQRYLEKVRRDQADREAFRRNLRR